MTASAHRKALILSIFTVGYNVVEGVVSIIAAIAAGSTALLGFGLDSFVESLSGSVMIWRFWQHGPEADEDQVAEVERKATRLVAYTFFVLGAFVTVDAGIALYRHEEPSATVLGLIIAIASLVVMPVLFYLKYRLGKLGNAFVYEYDPNGRYLYYTPRAHGGSELAGTPIVQLDVETKQRKVLAFLEPFYNERYGCLLKGTYSVAIDPSGERLYTTWNVSRTSRVWDCCALTVVHLPESERRP